ncbi:MAG: hypothetical protein PHC28_13290 [Flavobacterium sp.]|uniref:hypothetical protein n=1 Tax=Flavobacterium sp. TaxID=239 RepID=UPI00260FC5A6|nr:hypothetical protein [Flavobacterium sp.]MDD5151426.1 hypothetical protein [Flavobacterium sp.]
MANNTPTPYSCWVFHKDKKQHPISYQFVKSIYWLHKLLEKEQYDYHYINIYNRKTGIYLGRQYYDRFIIDKPPY